MEGALAIALGVEPRRLGLGPFFWPGLNPEMALVAEVVVRAGLLDILPVPDAPTWARRRPRPVRLTARHALIELALWSDAPGRTASQAAHALRAAAKKLDVRAGRATPKPLALAA